VKDATQPHRERSLERDALAVLQSISASPAVEI
jgi:hypothetical protein